MYSIPVMLPVRGQYLHTVLTARSGIGHTKSPSTNSYRSLHTVVDHAFFGVSIALKLNMGCTRAQLG